MNAREVRDHLLLGLGLFLPKISVWFEHFGPTYISASQSVLLKFECVQLSYAHAYLSVAPFYARHVFVVALHMGECGVLIMVLGRSSCRSFYYCICMHDMSIDTMTCQWL